MWLKSLLMVFVLIFVFSTSSKLTNRKKLKYKELEGDMLLSDKQFQWIYSKPTARNALLAQSYHWPDGIVYYRFGSEFSSSKHALILDAMKQISQVSCIRFEEAPEDATEYVNIVKPDYKVCSTAVGYQRKVQPLHLHRKCMKSGVIQHELLHSLGFFHEQSDPDRDNFVTVNYKNIRKESRKNFRKYSVRAVSSLSTGYDYSSILHYGKYFFSKNGEPTILPIQRDVYIGQRDSLSEKDVIKLNLLYNCTPRARKKRRRRKHKKDHFNKKESKNILQNYQKSKII